MISEETAGAGVPGSGIGGMAHNAKAGAGGVGLPALLLLGLALGLPCPSRGWAGETAGPAIRSGCEVDYPPFCIVHEDRRVDGFSVELMRAALGKMGCEVTFRTGPWSEVRGWLERGEIRALPLVGRNPEREPLFDFTVPYMTMHGAIVVRKETEGVHSLADLRGRRVCVMKGDNTEEFLRREDRGLEIVTAPTFPDAFQSLAEGRCDAVVIQRLVAVRLLEDSGPTNLKIVERPIQEFSLDFCFAVREGDSEMLSVLNEGLALAVADGTHRRLHAKWFAHLELPPDRPIVVGGDYDYPPFEFLDEEGRPTGFTVDLTRAIARELDMDVRIRLGHWEDMVAALRDGKIDALEGMFYSPERDRWLEFSPRYLVIHCVGIVRRGEGSPPTTLESLAGRDLVVQAEDAVLDALAERGIEARITTVETQEDVVRAVAEGRGACGLGTRCGALYAIRKNGWTDIVVGDRALYSGRYCFAVPQGGDALLAEFTEGLRVIKDSGEYQRIYEKWLGVYEPRAPARTALKYAALVAAPLLLITLLALLWSWSLRRRVSARTRELRESLGRFRSVFEAANVGKSITLPTGEIQPNRAFAGMLGYEPEELRGRTWRELTLPEDVPEMERHISAMLDGREDSVRFEKRYVRKDGGVVWADVSMTMMRDGSGLPLHLITTNVDISERKRAEERLRHQERLLREMGRIARIGGWEFDPDTGEGTWTDEVARIHDLDPADETSLERGLSFYRDESRARIVRAVREAIETGKAYDLELEMVSAKGVRKWVRTIGSPAVEDGKVVRVSGSFQDITSRKRAEGRIEHLNRVLRAIRDVNQLITHEKDRDQLLHRSCEILVSTRGYRSAWIALRGADGRLDASAECGVGEGFAAVRKGIDRGDWPGCYRRAQGQPGGIVTVYVPSSDCESCALADHYRDTVALSGRLRHAGRDFGMLVVALPEGLADDGEEQSLFRELVGDVSYALHAMETEQARDRSERTLRAVFQSASDGVLVAEAESGRLVLGNQAICRMLGSSEEELMGLAVADIHPAEAAGLVRSLLGRDVRGGMAPAEDVPMKRRDGSIFSVDVSFAPLELDGRRHIVGIYRDITARKGVEKALREAYDIVNRSSSVAFTWKNAEGGAVEFVSENVERLLGYRAEEFMDGRVSYIDCIHREDLPRVMEEVAGTASLENAAEFVHEPYRVIAKDGSVKVVCARTFILRAPSGRITHYKGVVEDITERRNLEAQLGQAQKMEAVGRLAGGLAHDYNNMLSVILGYAELAMGRVGAEDPLLNDLKEIRAAADRSKDITRQLLAFARKQTIAPEVLDLNATVDNMLRMLRKLIGENIDLAWHPGKVPGHVLMDPSQLDQILANLCVNACDAIAEVGRITIETGAASIGADYCAEHPGFVAGEFVLLAVSDDGCGMDHETMDHIFEPFFTTKRTGKGTGLGLATVYGTVKQNDGFINVYSEPGRGTTFRVYLPVHSGDITEKKRSTEDRMAEGGGETLLVVEDEKAISQLAERILSECNYEVLLAGLPSEAVEIARERSGEIDLLITDVVLPEMNGRELADRLKVLCPGIECVFMSGYSANVIAHRGVLDEGVHFLQKPFTSRGLAAKVREALEGKSK